MDQTNATRAQGQNLSEERGEPSCSAIAVRLPQYCDQHPSAGFLQAEVQFEVAGICSQAWKFHYAVAALSPAAIHEVADMLNSRLSTAAYDDLKTSLLQCTAASQRSRIQQLLSAEELGDRRPTELLRRMSQLLGNNARSINDTQLRELFLQRLPANVQVVLATACTMDLTGLAALADKVMEVATPTIAATSPSPGDNTAALMHPIQFSYFCFPAGRRAPFVTWGWAVLILLNPTWEAMLVAPYLEDQRKLVNEAREATKANGNID
ncbi:uncharacterized protein LOC142588691 [Dermacentor variabilis]|uniref:uncharacterized protein LOC142588691 n=1 Tax=Dermacentor variabilis TaxID=34621 RepID=UPI003F5AFE8E